MNEGFPDTRPETAACVEIKASEYQLMDTDVVRLGYLLGSCLEDPARYPVSELE